MKLKRVLNDRVAIRPDVAEKTFNGSSILKPDVVQAAEKPRIGTVIAVGPGMHTEKGVFVPMDEDVKVGARVSYATYAGTEVEIGDETIVFVRVTDLLGIVS